MTIRLAATKYRQGDRDCRAGGTSDRRPPAAPEKSESVTEMSTKVTCTHIDDLITSGTVNLLQSTDAAEHMARCKHCRGLARVLLNIEEEPVPLESRVKRIQAMMGASLQPVRPLAPARFFLGACAIIFLGVVAISVAPSGMAGWAALNGVQRIAVFATLAASAVLLAVSMIGQMVPGNKYALAPTLLPIAVLTVLMTILALTFRPREELAFVRNGLACVRNGLTFSIPAALLFWLLLRRGVVLFPQSIGAAVGGLAGLAGFSVLELNCPNVNVFHIVVWHWGVVLICAAGGALIGAAVEYRHWRNPKTG